MISRTRDARTRTTRSLRAAVALCAVAALTAGCSEDAQAEPWPPGDWVQIGTKTDQPGTGFEREDYDDPVGFDVGVARMAAAAIGRNPHFGAVRSSERQTALGPDGGFHLIVATYSINQRRMDGLRGEPGVDFVGPYAVTHTAFLQRSDSPRLRSKSDLQGKKVCTWGGTTSESILEKAGVTVSTQDDAGECVKLVRDGDAYAAFSDELLLHGFAVEHPELLVVPAASTDLPDDVQYYGIAMPKGHRKECGQIKEALKKYVEGVGERKWRDDFAGSFGDVPAHPFKPDSGLIDAYSCRDRLSR
ncbi:transporter substrate-binding domain-containing protein [Actinomadura algeriensis]|uniref:Glutamate transport system substrate-binding protein n=1 Tax=Actinomadura algeriensis TaxID=1679523 RepID=A0ABR9JRF3_9ACTN|nr:transporter substrate-binding domain-containing protein [Actinomadura algeriensis]MBE1533156.1 glutamate transport system substrate-binding protein [Actinomadura algeriensis]